MADQDKQAEEQWDSIKDEDIKALIDPSDLEGAQKKLRTKLVKKVLSAAEIAAIKDIDKTMRKVQQRSKARPVEPDLEPDFEPDFEQKHLDRGKKSLKKKKSLKAQASRRPVDHDKHLGDEVLEFRVAERTFHEALEDVQDTLSPSLLMVAKEKYRLLQTAYHALGFVAKNHVYKDLADARTELLEVETAVSRKRGTVGQRALRRVAKATGLSNAYGELASGLGELATGGQRLVSPAIKPVLNTLNKLTSSVTAIRQKSADAWDRYSRFFGQLYGWMRKPFKIARSGFDLLKWGALLALIADKFDIGAMIGKVTDSLKEKFGENYLWGLVKWVASSSYNWLLDKIKSFLGLNKTVQQKEMDNNLFKYKQATAGYTGERATASKALVAQYTKAVEAYKADPSTTNLQRVNELQNQIDASIKVWSSKQVEADKKDVSVLQKKYDSISWSNPIDKIGSWFNLKSAQETSEFNNAVSNTGPTKNIRPVSTTTSKAVTNNSVAVSAGQSSSMTNVQAAPPQSEPVMAKPPVVPEQGTASGTDAPEPSKVGKSSGGLGVAQIPNMSGGDSLRSLATDTLIGY